MKRIVFTIAALLLAVPLTSAAQPARKGGQTRIRKQTVKVTRKTRRVIKAQAGRLVSGGLLTGQVRRPVVLGINGPARRRFVFDELVTAVPTVRFFPTVANVTRTDSVADLDDLFLAQLGGTTITTSSVRVVDRPAVIGGVVVHKVVRKRVN
jgi:hypothetical protein